MAVKSTYNVPITTNFLGSIAQNFLYGNNALTLGNGGFCLGNMLNGTIGYGGSTAEVVAQYTAAGLFGLIGKVENYFESRSYKPAVTDNYRQQAEAKVDEKDPTLQKAIDTAQANVNTVNQQGKIITDAQTKIKNLQKDIEYKKNKYQTVADTDDEATKTEKENANKELDKLIEEKKAEIKAENDKIEEAEMALNRLDLGVDNLSDVKALTEAANNALTAKKDAKETAIKTEIANIKKKEQAEASKPATSKTVQQAQEKADKAEAKMLEAEAKAKEKKEKEAAKLREKDLEDYKKKFDVALQTAKNTKNLNDAKKIISDINENHKGDKYFKDLAAAFVKELKATFPSANSFALD